MPNPKLLATCCALSVASLSGAFLTVKASEFDFSAPSSSDATEINLPASPVPVQPQVAPASPSRPAATAAKPSIFDKVEVEDEDFVVMAVPRGKTGDYLLMIVEQKSDTQACWNESGTAPIEVDPLLMTFDFTGICSRMADSNAYSIRMNDSDLGLNYSIRVAKENGELLLRGYSNSDYSAPPIEIGRTYGVSSTGYTRFVLNPGWRLTRRVYGDKQLGHIYLTSDLPLAAGSTISQN